MTVTTKSRPVSNGMKTHIKKGDSVKVLTGVDRGKTGKVVRVFPKLGKALVEGVNMKKKHQRPRKEGQQGQVIEMMHPIHISNVARVGEKAKKPAKQKA